MARVDGCQVDANYQGTTIRSYERQINQICGTCVLQIIWPTPEAFASFKLKTTFMQMMYDYQEVVSPMHLKTKSLEN